MEVGKGCVNLSLKGDKLFGGVGVESGECEVKCRVGD